MPIDWRHCGMLCADLCNARSPAQGTRTLAAVAGERPALRLTPSLLAEFTAKWGALDPQGTGSPIVTGTPVQLFEYTTLLKSSYEEAALYSLGAIALLALVHFRSLVCVLLALVPVGIGTLWTVGIMGGCGVR